MAVPLATTTERFSSQLRRDLTKVKDKREEIVNQVEILMKTELFTRMQPSEFLIHDMIARDIKHPEFTKWYLHETYAHSEKKKVYVNITQYGTKFCDVGRAFMIARLKDFTKDLKSNEFLRSIAVDFFRQDARCNSERSLDVFMESLNSTSFQNDLNVAIEYFNKGEYITSERLIRDCMTIFKLARKEREYVSYPYEANRALALRCKNETYTKKGFNLGVCEFVSKKEFLRDPIIFMATQMVERNPKLCANEDRVRTFVARKIPNYATKIGNFFFLRDLLERLIKNNPMKESIKKVFEQSLANYDFQTDLRKGVYDLNDSCKFDTALRQALTIFRMAKILEIYKPEQQ